MPKTTCLKQNKGFTLVEMVVVLVLMTIFLGVVAMGIIAVQDQAEQISTDNSAENIFVAAQNKITQMNASGQLAEKCEALKGSDGKYIADMIVPIYKADGSSPAGTDYITKSGQSPYNEVYQNMLMTDADIWVDGKVSDIISLRANAGDYDKYLTNPAGYLSEGTRFLFELISESISDREVLNGAIAIELAPEDAQVFSAFYSRKADKLVYAEEDSAAGGVVDISRRSYSKRHDKLLGYYGVETLTHIDVLPPEELPLGELSVRNGDTLKYHLKFGAEVADVDPTKLKYTITVYDSVTSRPALIFKIADDQVIGSKNDDIKQNLVKCSATRIDHEQNATPMGVFEIPIFWEKFFADETRDGLSFILDAADSSADTKLLDADGQARKIREGGLLDCDFSKTLSFFRFGTWTDTDIPNWTDNVFVIVDAEDDGSEESNLEAGGSATSPVTSPYFDKAEYVYKDTEAANKEYLKKIDIRNPRHLYNVRYFEDLDIVTLGLQATEYDESTIYHFKYDYCLREDIDWGEFADTTNNSLNSSYYASLRSTTNHKSDTAEFPSFRELREKDTFSGKYDDDFSVTDITDNLQYSHKINGLEISKANNQLHGIYKNYTDGQILPTGLFVENRGDIIYLALDQITVTGDTKVGSICGVNSGRLKYCGTLSTRSAEHPEPSIVSGIRHVGGVFGYSASKGISVAGDTIYENLSNAARVTGQEYVGGITGWMSTGSIQLHDGATPEYATIRNVGFKNCDNSGQIMGLLAGNQSTYGKTEAERKSVRYIGGIVGYIKSTNSWSWDNYTGREGITSIIEKCYSYPVYDQTYDKVNVGGTDISLASTIENSVRTATHHSLATNTGNLAVIRQLNSGWYVGGIAGCAIDVRITDSGVRCTVTTDDTGNSTYYHKDAGGNGLSLSGYLFGDRYVGGIAGFNAAVIDACYNYTTVFGNDYVGGMAGIIGEVTESDGDLTVVIPAKSNNTYKSIYRTSAQSSVNNGRVFALYDNAGGIAGRCYGSVEGSMSQNSNETDICRVSGRNYVGSICGYFLGKRGFGDADLNKKIYSNGAIDGENFIGGVCGYFRKDGAIPFTNVSYYGSVEASGSFAGGFMGLVTESELMSTEGDYINKKKVFTSGCSSLKGAYFVGGALGGVLVNQGAERYYNILVNLPSLDINAIAYAGGAIGYIAIANKNVDQLETYAATMAGLDVLGDEMIIADSKLARNDTRGIQTVTDMVTGIDFGNRMGGKITFRGFNDKPIPMVVSVHNITPLYEDLVYASGFVGGDSINTNVKFTYFNKLENCGADFIKCTYIEKAINLYNPETMRMEGKTVKMAYSSKLIGINNSGNEITACYVTGKYSSQSTYRGGLVEVNNGKIDLSLSTALPGRYYQPYYSDDTDCDRIGGVCGKNNGEVIMHSAEHMVVSGRNIVGGMVGENGGKITLKSSHNEEGVVGTGYCVGGVVGVNYGTVTTPDYNTNRQDKNFMVQGATIVGGIIGEQVGSIDWSNRYVKPSHTGSEVGIRATEGIAGGLIGRITTLENNGKDVKLYNCHYGYQTPVEGKVAGGIVGEIVIGGNKNILIDSCRVEYTGSNEVQIKNIDNDSRVGGIVCNVRREGGSGKVTIDRCVVQADVRGGNGKRAANGAGIVYEAGEATEINRCRVYAVDAGHGITAGKAISITNCLDATCNGPSLFGDANTLKNNYSIEHLTGNHKPTEQEPADRKNYGVYTVYTDKENKNYRMYALYEAGGDEYYFDTGMLVNTSHDPMKIQNFYGQYTEKVSGKENWKIVDEAFAAYMSGLGITVN